jgi:uncharacterized protein YhfF
MVKRMSIARSLPPMQLGYPRTELRRRLVDAVQAGAKTATAGLCADYESEGEALPKVGDRFLLLDYDDEPIAVVEATEVRVLRVADIDLAFARDEGEGFETVEEWRAAHEMFWDGHEISDDSLVVAERFRVLESL